MNQITKTNQVGFTLIEILLYLSMSVIMIGLIGGVGVNVLSGSMSIKGEEDLQYNAQFVTEKIRTLVSQAESIESPSVGGSSSVLSLVMNDENKNPTVIDVIDGRVRVKEGAGEEMILSGSSVEVSAHEFINVTQSGASGSIRIVLDMGLFNPNNSRLLRSSTTLYTTVNVQYP